MPGKTSKQVTLFNRDSVQSNASYYDNALQSRGWVKRQDTKAKDSPDENNLLSYAKDGAELTLEIVHKRDSQATLVVSNLVGVALRKRPEDVIRVERSEVLNHVFLTIREKARKVPMLKKPRQQGQGHGGILHRVRPGRDRHVRFPVP